MFTKCYNELCNGFKDVWMQNQYVRFLFAVPPPVTEADL